MKQKSILAAMILSGSIGLVAQPGSAQSVPGKQLPEQKIPERIQPPALGTEKPGVSGMSADEINKIKEALKAKGLNPGPIDGKLDPQTQQALRRFQQDNNLPVTGNPDPATAAKLGVSLGGPKAGPETGKGIPKAPGAGPELPSGKGVTK